MTPIYDGWTPPVNRRCTRCGERVFSQIYCLCDKCRQDDADARKMAELGILPKPDLCQRPHPDVVIEVDSLDVFCAICGGSVSQLRAAIALYDPLQDVADARREARFGKNL